MSICVHPIQVQQHQRVLAVNHEGSICHALNPVYMDKKQVSDGLTTGYHNKHQEETASRVASKFIYAFVRKTTVYIDIL